MMKKFLLGLSVAVLTVFTANAQSENSNVPEITFDAEVIDYGTIKKGADGNRVFVFTNTGEEPLIITNAKVTCGCTVPSKPNDPIAPGEKGEIKVKYDTKRVGPFTKTVTISSNAKTATKVLHIKGVVEAPIAVKTSPVKNEVSTVMLKK